MADDDKNAQSAAERARKRAEEERKKRAAEKAQKEAEAQAKKTAETRNTNAAAADKVNKPKDDPKKAPAIDPKDLKFKDKPQALDLVGEAVSGAGNALKKGAGYLVNEDAWKAIMPGGEKADWKDWANVALDASMLIPGAGVGGALARGGLKLAGKAALRSGEDRLASKLLANEVTDTATRKLAGDYAAANVAKDLMSKKGARAFVGETEALTPLARGAGGKLGKKAGASTDDMAAELFGRDTVKGAAEKIGAKTPSRFDKAALNRAGGLAQTGRRTALTGALTLGANAAEAKLTNIVQESAAKKDQLSSKPVPDKDGIPNYPGGATALGVAPGYYLVAEDKTTTPLSPSEARRMRASNPNMGGSADGAQVIHLGR